MMLPLLWQRMWVVGFKKSNGIEMFSEFWHKYCRGNNADWVWNRKYRTGETVACRLVN